MKKRLLSILLVLCLALALAPSAPVAGAPKVSISEQYVYAGAYHPWWTLDAIRCAPVVTDLDGDGKLEVLNAAVTLYVMDAATGKELWRVNAGRDRASTEQGQDNVDNGRVFCDFKVLDIDGDGSKEIVIAYGNGMVSVLNNQGYFKWQKQPTTTQIRSLAVDDLNGDGKMSIIVGAATIDSDPKSVWMYDCYGNLCPGWPQLDNSQNANYQTSYTDRAKTAWSAAVYSNGITTGDLDGDGIKEIIVPIDSPFINAYRYDGSLVRASDIWKDRYGGRMWGKIGLWEDYNEELANKNEGWGKADELGSRATTIQGQLATAGTVYTDVDGDGTAEVVVATMMWDRTTYDTKGNNVATLKDSRYMTVFILNQDRTRYKNEKLGYDWTSVPNEINSEVGLHIKPDDTESGNANLFPVPVCEDLDGDGKKEILFNSFDGKVHCFSLDWKPNANYKNLSNTWSFTLPKSAGSVYEYATPVVCKDLDGDGKKEVIFASWLDGNPATGVNGALYVLSSDGELLAKTDIHDGYSSEPGYNNGVMAAPVVEDIDKDGKYEVLLNTRYYALCAYELNMTPASTPSTPTPSFKIRLSAQNLTVDRRENIACEKYNIDGNNYFKLRDLAELLNGTGSQFEVGYDNASRTISITTGVPYTQRNGTELVLRGDQSAKAVVSPQAILINGVKYDNLKVYNIGDTNFFQLRELGKLLNFEVQFDEATNTAIVNSAKK